METGKYIEQTDFCQSLFSYNRNKTREVNIGDIPLGGNNPVRIQSMTNTNTEDMEATVRQIIELSKAGSDYVRVTVPNLKSAESLASIKEQLKSLQITVPLIADVHFNPAIAEICAQIIEKVRINPGNYGIRKNQKSTDFSEDEYRHDLEIMKINLNKLIGLCKKYNTVLRIGSNHGSLSERILNRYGDTPQGMVESALEMVRICREYNFNDIVLSMKSSNPKVMVNAYRLLVVKMNEEEMNYPLHLGVTEAGIREDAVIKSAAGIGALLEDGIGDTIRVSLLGDPVKEIPVAKKLVARYNNKKTEISNIKEDKEKLNQLLTKTKTERRLKIGGANPPVVISDLSESEYSEKEITRITDNITMRDKIKNNETPAPDYIYLGSKFKDLKSSDNIGLIYDHDIWLQKENENNIYPLIRFKDAEPSFKLSSKLNFILFTSDDLTTEKVEKLIHFKNSVIIIEATNNSLHLYRELISKLKKHNPDQPYILKYINYHPSDEDMTIDFPAVTGSLLIDGYGSGIMISKSGNCSNESLILYNDLSFGILQACKRRIFSTEYVVCPSCGRTKFDIESISDQIKNKTNHLNGLKIGIMGCIVNGPGEMGDADYGYVGTGEGKVSLFRNKDVVKSNINANDALNELIKLIKSDNKWIDPS